MKFILTVSESSYECSTDHIIPIEADSKESIQDYFLSRIKLSWIEEHGHLDYWFKLDDSLKVLGYDDFTFKTASFLNPDYFDWKTSDFTPTCKIESKEMIDCLIRDDLTMDLQTLDEWFQQNKISI